MTESSMVKSLRVSVMVLLARQLAKSRGLELKKAVHKSERTEVL
jgi:hypothetical protein